MVAIDTWKNLWLWNLLEQFVLIVGGIVHLFVAITPQMFQVRRSMWCMTKTLELGCYTKTEHTGPVCESLHAEIRRKAGDSGSRSFGCFESSTMIKSRTIWPPFKSIRIVSKWYKLFIISLKIILSFWYCCWVMS
jgi:hypothetical protein